jgi:AraC-like DNA-binding protein
LETSTPADRSNKIGQQVIFLSTARCTWPDGYDLVAEIKLCIASTKITKAGNENKLQFFKDTWPYIEKRQNPKLTRLWHSKYGFFLIQFGDTPKGIIHFEKSYRLAKKYEIEDGLIQDATLLGTAYAAVGKRDSAMALLMEGLKMATQKKDSLGIIKVHLGLAFHAAMTANSDQESKHLEQAKTICIRKGYADFLGIIYASLMRMALANANFEQVIQYGIEAEKVNGNDPLSFNNLYIDSLLYVSYKKLGKSSEALIHLEKFQSYDAMIKQQDYESFLKETKYIQDLKEKNLTIQILTLTLQNRAKSRKIIIISNVFLITIIAFWIYIRKTYKSNVRVLYANEKFIETTIENVENKPFTAGETDMNENPLSNDGETEPYFHWTSVIKRKKLYEELLQVIQERKLFLDPELSQKDVISLLGTNKKYLYEALNQNSGENFKSILNRLRVDEAKKIIKKEARKGNAELPAELYSMAGFNSAASYYRLFKEFTGLTPKEYTREYFRYIHGQRDK